MMGICTGTGYFRDADLSIKVLICLFRFMKVGVLENAIVFVICREGRARYGEGQRGSVGTRRREGDK